MDSDLARKLCSLPPLDLELAEETICKLCGGRAPLFDIVDFNKFCSNEPYSNEPYALGSSGIPVKYYRCLSCQFIFSILIDDWTQEEIARFIYNDDYIKVDGEYVTARPLRTAAEMAHLLRGCEDLRILDYGSGSGQFADEMTRRGFKDLASYDPFSQPVRPDGPFDLITCFEVIEHSAWPQQTLRDMSHMLSSSGSIVVGQTIQPDNIEQIKGSWWYLAPRNGHVSTFADKTFFMLAATEGLIYRRGSGLYGFSRPELAFAVQTAIERIGSIVTFLTLLAPREERDSPGLWHDLEQEGRDAFRWTAAPEVSWLECELGGGLNNIQIPFVMEIETGFAAGCEIIVDDRILPTQVRDGALVAEIKLPGSGSYNIKLRTPNPRSPRELRDVPDGRLLGLAVRAN